MRNGNLILISQTTDSHFANYRFPFRKLQIPISQTTDFHFANYRFPFRKLQIPIWQTTDFHFANYRFPFRKLQISISQTTDFHFANYRFPFRFANYSKPTNMASKFATKNFWNSCARLFQVQNIYRMNTRRCPSVPNTKEKKARGLLENNNADCNLTYSHSCLCRGIPECVGYVTPLVDCEMHNKVMNYHVQYLLTLRSVFGAFRKRYASR